MRWVLAVSVLGLGVLGCLEGSITPTATATLSVGPAHATTRRVAPGQADVALLQLSVRGDDQKTLALTGLVLSLSDPTGAIDSLRLIEDADADGKPGAGERVVAAMVPNQQDLATALSETLEAKATRTFLLVGAVKASAPSGALARALVEPAGVSVSLDNRPMKATGAKVESQVVVSPGRALTLAAGPANPGAATVPSAAGAVPMLHFTATVDADSAEAATLTSVRVRGSGTASERDAVTSVTLHLDADRDGLVGAPDTLLGTATFAADDGTATFANLTSAVPAGGATFLVTYALSGGGGRGQTLAAALADADAVTAVGAVSGKSLLIAGVPVSGGTRTIEQGGSVGVAAGLNNPGNSSESVGAADVPMLQLALTPPLGMATKLSQVVVRGSGSGNEAAQVSRVRLFNDVNQNGVLELSGATPDLLLGAPATFTGDDGTATFTGLTESLPAAGLTLLVVYDFAAAAIPGQNFRASVSSELALTVVDAATGARLPASGTPVSGGLKTITAGGTLAVSAGVNTPGATNEGAGASDVAMLQFTLTASALEAVEVSSITVRASGSGDDSTDVAGVRLFRDVNDNGQLDTGGANPDLQVGVASTFSADNGTATFSGFTQTVAATARVNFLVVYDFAGSALPGRTFAAAITSGAAITAAGATTSAVITPGGSAQGAGKTIASQGSLTLSTGVATPGATNESASATGVPVLQLALAASTVEAVSVTSLTVRASGSGNDGTAIAAVRLVRDVGANGLVDATDPVLGSGVFNANDGVVTFAGLSERVDAGARLHLLVAYDFNGSALPGQTFAASVASGAAVAAQGLTSAAVITPSGSASSAAKTIQTAGSLSLTTGVATPGATNESAASTNVPVLQFTLSASTVEAAKVTAMTVRASGSGNDATGLAAVRLVRDTNDDGLPSMGELVLGTGTYGADNGVVTFSGLNENLAAGGRASYVVVYDFAAGVLPGQTFAAAVTGGAAVTAMGVSSGAVILAGGAATGSAKTILTSGSLSLAAGVATSGNTTEAAGASGVPVLQAAFSASTAEAVRVTSVTVRASGSGDDVAGVTAVRLVNDTDGDGVRDVGEPVLGTGTYGADNGVVTFSGLAEVIPAGGRANLLVLYDFSSAVLPGQTFAAAISSGAAVSAVGVSSGVAVVAGGSAASNTKTIQSAGSLSIATGTATRGASSVGASQAGVEALQFRLTAGAVEAVRVQSIAVRASGSGNDASAISLVRLFKDLDDDGALDVGEPRLGGPGLTYSMDNGIALFTGLSEVIPAGGSANYLVVYDFSGSALPGQTFAASLTAGTSVTCVGQSSGAAIAAAGSAGGSALTVASATLFASAGPANPTNDTALIDATGVRMLQARLTAGASESVTVRAVTITSGGSANDALAVGSVRLFEDVNGDGVIGAQDAALGTPQAITADNGAVTFQNLSLRVSAGATTHLLATADFTGFGPSRSTVSLSLSSNAALVAESTSTAQPAVVTGAPVTGGERTLSSPFNTWDPITTVGAPAARAGHSAVATSTQMLVWGGEGTSGYRGDGASYSPATDTWTALPTAGAPSPRAEHAAALVNAQMVIWGGFNGVTFRDDGARFDPVTSTWTALPALGAPAARAGAVAVAATSATQQRLVVWGGVNGTGAVGTGGRYNALTDAWEPMSTTGAPSPRSLHTAVWTGDRVLIWGGYNNTTGNYLADGALYDPVTDTWTAMAASPLLARAQHAAVWTGQELVIYGGANALAYFDGGAAYSPATNTWRTLNSINLPGARAQATAVMTSKGVVVWGGFSSGPVGTGGRYQLNLNQWFAVATAGAPVPRLSHTAVVVGAAVLVWGGTNTLTFLNSGGRYTP